MGWILAWLVLGLVVVLIVASLDDSGPPVGVILFVIVASPLVVVALSVLAAVMIADEVAARWKTRKQKDPS